MARGSRMGRMAVWLAVMIMTLFLNEGVGLAKSVAGEAQVETLFIPSGISAPRGPLQVLEADPMRERLLGVQLKAGYVLCDATRDCIMSRIVVFSSAVLRPGELIRLGTGRLVHPDWGRYAILREGFLSARSGR